MAKEKKSTINVQGTAITILSKEADDFICLTDMAKKFGGDDLIHNWMRNRNTLEYIGIWEQIHNPDFKGVEFDTFKIRVMNLFPNTNIFKCVSVSHPIMYKVVATEFFCHIGKANKIISFFTEYSNGSTLHIDG